MVRVHHTDDVDEAWARLAPVLAADPVRHNLPLTLLDAGRIKAEQGLYWWIGDGSTVVGICLQASPGQPCLVVGDDRSVLNPLVEHVAASAPHLPGVNGEARIATAFAAAWAEVMRAPAIVTMAQRLYQLGTLAPPPATEGTFRPATPSDAAILDGWAIGFQRDTRTGSGPGDHQRAVTNIRWKIDRGEVFVWDTDRPASMVAHTRPIEAVSRVQAVYTPPELRNQGLAAACVSALVERLLTAGCRRCVLFTDLGNPTSNALYQRLGFTAVQEHLNITLGLPAAPGRSPAGANREAVVS